MSREIKFRAWNKFHKTMLPVYSINFDCDLFFCKSDGYSGRMYGKIDCEVMQFTGCKDPFDTEIYEGDIVFLDAKMLTGEIVMDCYAWKIKTGDSFEWLCDWFEDVQVIGNIHQHPDLLEQPK